MTVYILEDEMNILKYIISLIDEIPYLQIVGYSGEISKAKEEIPQLNPNLILADIRLKDGDSFKLFAELDAIPNQIIFITAYNQYAIEALNLGAFAYLLKPIDPDAFKEVIDRCFKKAEENKFSRHQLEIAENHFHGKNTQPTKIALKSFDFTQIIAIDDILYCKSDKGYTVFYLKNNSSFVVSKVLKEYESLLPASLFVRCHQSYMVNGNYISKYYRDGYLELINGEKIPVSDRKKNIVQDFIEQMH